MLSPSKEFPVKKAVQITIFLAELGIAVLRFITLQLRSLAEHRGYNVPKEVCIHEMPTFNGGSEDESMSDEGKSPLSDVESRSETR